MAAPTILQDYKPSSDPFTLAGVTAGSCLVMMVYQTSSGGRSYIVSDDRANTWVKQFQGTIGGRQFAMFYAEDVASGDTVIEITTAAYSDQHDIAHVYEIGDCTVDQMDNLIGPNTTSHTAGSIDTAADSTVVVGGQSAYSANFNYGAGYSAGEKGTQNLSQHKSSAAPITGETGPFTSGTSRQAMAGIISFVPVGGGGFQAAWAVNATTVAGVLSA